MRKSGHEVIIAGAGPTGLMLAGELALAGIDAAIVERRVNQDVAGQRAGGLHARTIEIFDQRGIADRFLAAGKKAQVAGFAGVFFDISDLPTRHPYGLGIWQNQIERILAGWIEELGVTVYRGTELTGIAQDESGVDVMLADGTTMRGQYLVGCDGGRSFVRKAAGIAFSGSEPTTSNIIGEVELTAEPPWGMRRDTLGIHGLSKMDDGMVRVMVTERAVGAGGEPTLGELSAELTAIYGSDFGVHNPRSLGRFTDATRQAETYRKGRILVAGDAAHIHPPDGGQGLQTGVQDAINLGWKLAAVIRGTAPDTLLDSYHSERHPVAARILRNTMASVALRRDDERTGALRAMIGDLLKVEQAWRTLAATMSGLDIRYDLGEGHPLLGRRMPDFDIVTADGPTRVYQLLHRAQPVLVNFGDNGSLDVDGWSDRVQLVEARSDGPWELPVLGTVSPPAAVLVRPDGYVGWVGDGSDAGLAEALTRWFGAADDRAAF